MKRLRHPAEVIEDKRIMHIWMSSGASFTNRAGSSSGTAAQDFKPEDVALAHLNGWVQMRTDQWPGLLDVPEFGVSTQPGSMNPVKVFQSNIPFVKASSGTSGSAGAITAMTASPTGFFGGPSYIYLPANCWNSNAAGWFYATFTSTTAATAFNNTYASGQPFIPATTTAFSASGSGFTGVTSAVTALSFTLPGNMMGPNGVVEFAFVLGYNGTTNSKAVTIKVGSSTVFSQANATAANIAYTGLVLWSNLGATSAQSCQTAGGTGYSTVANTYTTLDTTANQTVTVNITNATATDWTSIESFSCVVYPG